MWLNILLFFIGVFTFFYWYITKEFGYFKARGVVEAPASFPFGSEPARNMFTGKANIMTALECTYKQYPNDKMIGVFMFGQPNLVVHDVELAKQIMIKDFEYFVDRRSLKTSDNNEVNKALNRMLTNISGEKWKQLRSKLSPVFSSGKLRLMVPKLDKVGADMKDYFTGLAKSGEEFNCKDVMTKYTLDAIASCGFGVEINSFKDPDSIFATMARKVTNPTSMIQMKFMIQMFMPRIAKLLGLTFMDVDAGTFFLDLVKKSVEEREKSGARYNDFIDQCLDVFKGRKVDLAEEKTQFEKEGEVKAEKELVISDDELIPLMSANLFLLFFAGFDTTSLGLTIVMMCLGLHPEIQQNVYQEINDAVEENDGSVNLDYDRIAKLTYLEQAIHESFRYYGVVTLERQCSKDYKVPGTDFVVPKGMIVQIPSFAIMKDERIYPNPEVFNPDNFSAENKAKRPSYAYYGFGQGPRNCIAMRFAVMQVKIALIKLLYSFKLVKGPKTPDQLLIDPRSLQGMPKGGPWLKVEER